MFWQANKPPQQGPKRCDVNQGENNNSNKMIERVKSQTMYQDKRKEK